MRSLLFVPTVLLLSCPAFAASRWVPDDHPTIQAAIVAAVPGDEIVVRPGVYAETIDFLGKAITLRSEHGAYATTLEAVLFESVVTFQSGEGAGSVLRGFRIAGGDFYNSTGAIYCLGSSPTIVENLISDNGGGGMYCKGASPTIRDNAFRENFCFGRGGAIGCEDGSHPLILGNLIVGNRSEKIGGGISCWDSSPIIDGNLIADNVVAPHSYGGGTGGGIYCWRSAPTIINNVIDGNRVYGSHGADVGGLSFFECTGVPVIRNNRITNNTASTYPYGSVEGGAIGVVKSTLRFENLTVAGNRVYGGRGAGICVWEDCDITITNSIFWDNISDLGGSELSVGTITAPSVLTLEYCDVAGGAAAAEVYAPCILNFGPGMLDTDPLFTAAGAGDYRLQQDPVPPGISNPCVDAGDPTATMIGGSTRSDWVQDAGVIDLGFHFTAPLASATPRYAVGNPPSYTAPSPPVLGGSFVGEVDLVGTTGHDLAMLAGYLAPATWTLSGGQTMLVNAAHPSGEVLGWPIALGPVASITVAIPADPAFAGLEVFTQAVHVGGIQPFALSNTLDLVLGK